MKDNLAADFDFRHQTPIQVRFSDVDPLGHINNSILFQYFDCGRIHYMQDVIPSISAWNETPLVLVHVAANFLLPAFFSDDLMVETKTLGFGNRSMKMVQRLKDRQSGEVKSVCHAILSGFDPQNNSSAPVDKKIKEVVMQYEANLNP